MRKSDEQNLMTDGIRGVGRSQAEGKKSFKISSLGDGANGNITK